MELFSPGHLVVLVVLAAVLFFGWKQLPDMSRSLGRSLRIFRTELKGMSEDDAARAATAAPPAGTAPAPAVPAPPAAATPAAATPAVAAPPAVPNEPAPAEQPERRTA